MQLCVFKSAKFLLGSQFNMPAKRPDQMNKAEAAFIMSVFMELLIVTAYGLVTFWNVALIEENLSANCVCGFDCFPFNRIIIVQAVTFCSKKQFPKLTASPQNNLHL